ncbi:hypothetical protein Bca4012_045855 [Brassica carinata]|uniref:Uncharacterized protein n=1 Tax=Brassica carinata TaxID=52824 RepID=A0A8X7UCI3_BRACI|nr:hypothetical protein Bca52824_056157 [Brassica carinata]
MASSKENPWFPEKRCDYGSNLGEPPAHRPPDPLDPPDYAPLVDFPPLPTSPATITSKTASSERKKMISTTSDESNAKVVVPDPPDTDECLEDSMELYNPGNEPPAVTDMEIELIHTSPPVGSTPDRPDNDLIETSDEIPQEVESLISDPLIPIQSIPISSPIPPINTQKPSHSSPPPPQPHKTSLFHPPLPKPILFLDSLQPMPPLLDPI